MTMRILELRINNVKGIEALEFKPGKTITQVKGRNGAGKTSVLDAVAMLLGGKRHEPKEPLRKGAEKGSIVAELDEYVIEKTITPKDTYLKVQRRDGQPLGMTPQQFLNKLVGAGLAFDPLEFVHKAPKEQWEDLMRAAGLDVDQIRAYVAKVTETRRDIGRDRDRAEKLAQSMPPNAEAPKEPVDAAAMTRKFADLSTQVRARKDAERAIQNTRADIEHLRARLAEETEREATLQAIINTPDQSKALAEVERQMQDMQALADAYNREQARQKALSEATALAKEYDAQTAKLDKVTARTKQALADANLGVEGLEVTESGGVLLNGVPIEQASTSEQIRLAVQVAVKMPGDMKIMLIRRGESLDHDSRRLLHEALEKADAQALMEVVDDTGPGDLRIVEGAE